MELPYIPDDIPLDDKGNVDVTKEMEYLEILRETGYDITDMESLLFTDIEDYKEKRSSIIDVYNSMDAKGFGPGMELDLDGDETEEEDILLYGGPILDHQQLDEENVDISLEKEEDAIPPMMGGLETTIGNLSPQEEIISENHPPSVIDEQFEDQLDLSDTEDIDDVPNKKDQHLDRSITSHKGFFIGFIVVVVVTMLAAGSYLFLFNKDNENGEEFIINAEFTISDIDPLIGDILNFSAKSIGEDISYEWQIIPDDYVIIGNDATSSSFEVYFKKPGSYRVDLKVSDDQDILTEHEFIDIDNREITIERERYGDTSLYDLSGHMTVENVDDMIQEKNIYKFETLDIDFWTENNNPMSTSILDSISKGKDGLGMEYHRMERNTDQFLRFSGTINRKSGEFSSITGTSSLSQQNHVDLFNQRSFRTFSDTSTHISIPVTSQYTIDYDMDESMILYPSLDRESNDLRIEDITEGRNISVGDVGIARWGLYDLTWEAVELELILDRPSVMVEFQMDQSSKNDLKLKDFSMIHWISSDVSSPVRTILNITSKDNIQHPSTIDIKQDMVNFDPGNEFVIYGSVDHRHDLVTRVDTLDPTIASEFHDDWDMVPRMGSLFSSIPSDLGPVPSLQIILDSIEYSLWSTNKDDLIVAYSNFSNFGNKLPWRFSISEPESEWGWNDTVIEGNTIGGKHTKIRPVELSRTDIPSILTFSGAEKILKDLLPKLDRDSTTGIYGKALPAESDSIRLNENSITTRVDHPYPKIGLVDPSLGGSIPYCLVIESFDGTLEVGLDMTNGQISYIIERSIA